MSEPRKPTALKAATIVWALVVVAILACTATGVVTLFGSKFGPGFRVSADALAGDEPAHPRLQRADAGAPAPPTPAGP
ncbi:MAG: hypothetical protein JNJ54_26015 [Myxococcaceae bacterium]|nr:hypothetical protein [Myxococcaceae bacterium]